MPKIVREASRLCRAFNGTPWDALPVTWTGAASPTTLSYNP
ncbi:MAG TPA: hypothetical protein VLD18_06915 [Verrucomicrobiae bacterium]|nr:hypothetical protein [Verrucomicrobiae bacterium]